MKNILLIGAGQLGSRHLQGLSKLLGDNSIYIIDPSLTAIEISKERLNEVAEKNINNKYYFLTEYENIPDNFNLAVIATNSDVRKNVLLRLLDIFRIENIIIEKFLFQKETEFYEIEKLIKEKKANMWVNCPRRMYPEYKEIKEFIKGKNILHVNIFGTNWAMASNAIHFIDLISFLIDSNEYDITENILINNIFENKRKGFVEFNGKILGYFANNVSFAVTSIPSTTTKLDVEIYTDDAIVTIDQVNQLIEIQKIINGSWTSEDKKLQLYFQSNLTNLAAEQIFAYKNCDLTTYESSMKLHLPLLKLFTEHYKKVLNLNEVDKCPIT